MTDEPEDLGEEIKLLKGMLNSYMNIIDELDSKLAEQEEELLALRAELKGLKNGRG